MTTYKHFASEFPSRCMSALDDSVKAAAAHNADFSVTIAICTGVLATVRDWWMKDDAPVRQASQLSNAEEKAISELRANMEKPVSQLAADDGFVLGKVPFANIAQLDSAQMGSVSQSRADAGDWRFGRLTRVIRNGLAHGNIWIPEDQMLLNHIVVASTVDHEDERTRGLKSGKSYDAFCLYRHQIVWIARKWSSVIESVSQAQGSLARLMRPDVDVAA